MKENMFVLLCWLVLVDSSILLCYWLSVAFKRATKKLISLFVIHDSIGVEKTDKP